MTTPILNLSQIRDASDLARKTVDVPEWGGAVILQELTARARDTFELETLERERLREAGKPVPPFLLDVRARLVGRCLVDESGEPLCSTPEDFGQLAGKNADVVDRLFDVCRELCGMTRSEVEEEGKGSEDDPSA